MAITPLAHVAPPRSSSELPAEYTTVILEEVPVVADIRSSRRPSRRSCPGQNQLPQPEPAGDHGALAIQVVQERLS